MSVFVSAAELNERVQTGQKQTVIAALWDAQEGKAWSKFQSEHVPTALFCDPSSQLAGMPGREVGRNPLPSDGVVAKAVAGWGIEDGKPVYIYDGGSGLFAARAWWVLRWAGVKDVHIVDGGYAAWHRGGFETIAGPGGIIVPREPEALNSDSVPTATMEDVRSFGGTLLDTRDTRRFEGRREILDLRAGHIPGAVNLPVRSLFDDTTNTVKDTEHIRAALAEHNITQNTDPAEVIVYSGSGNHSALLLAAMEHAGLPVLTHYVGGWSQWSANRDNRVATNV